MTELDELEGDNRPPSYIENGKLVLRASAYGSKCLYELVAPAQGYEPGNLPANMMRAFSEGHKAEPIIIKQLTEEYSLEITGKQNQEDVEIIPGVILRYHPDGIVLLRNAFNKEVLGWSNPLTQPAMAVLEIKNLSDGLWQKFVRHGMASVIAEYEWQLAIMMHHTGFPGLWCARNKGFPPDKETGKKPFCEDEGKLHFQLVTTPPVPLNELRDKALHIKELVYGEDITDTGQECNDTSHFPCRYLHLRPEPEQEQKVGISTAGIDTERGVYLARQFVFLKGQKDEIDQKYEATRDELIALSGLSVGEKGELRVDELNEDGEKVGEWVVPILTGTNRSALDWTAMPEEIKVLIQSYQKEKKYLYIRNARRIDGSN